MRITPALVLFCLLPVRLLAVEARNSPADYPEQVSVEDFKAGIEYMVRTFSADGQSFLIDDYLILEVGVYPQGEAKVDLRRFKLRINGKNLVLTQTPGMVAASLKYPDWTRKPSLEVAAGPMVFGRRPRVGRFPGDPTQTQPMPRPQPDGPELGGQEQVDYEHLVKRSALPEGRFNKPLAGLVYFPYDGKLKKIRTVELVLDDAVLKLR